MSDTLDLQPGEEVLKVNNAQAAAPVSAGGKLHLTNTRLFWKRSWLNVPFLGPRSFSVPISEVHSCLLINTGSLAALRNVRLVVTTADAEHTFLLGKSILGMHLFSHETSNEWREAIMNAAGIRAPSQEEKSIASERIFGRHVKAWRTAVIVLTPFVLLSIAVTIIGGAPVWLVALIGASYAALVGNFLVIYRKAKDGSIKPTHRDTS